MFLFKIFLILYLFINIAVLGYRNQATQCILIQFRGFTSVIFLNVYLFILREREREHVSPGGAEREMVKENPSRLHTVIIEPDTGLEHMNHEIRAWAEIKSRTHNWLSHLSTLSAILNIGKLIGQENKFVTKQLFLLFFKYYIIKSM